MEATAVIDAPPQIATSAALAQAASDPPDAGRQSPTTQSAPADVGRVLGLRVPVSVVLAERQMGLKSILEITTGTIIEFDVPFDAELVLCVADRRIGRGKALKVGENFGLCITKIETVQDRIDALGGR